MQRCIEGVGGVYDLYMSDPTRQSGIILIMYSWINDATGGGLYINMIKERSQTELCIIIFYSMRLGLFLFMVTFV